MPKISVIVPVYKVEPYLARCVDSILAQTFTDFELILVDDGSPDSCPAICDNYKEKDSRVIVLHKENGGVSSARNAGLDRAAGEYIAFADSDDSVTPDWLAKAYAAASGQKADIVSYGSYQTSKPQETDEKGDARISDYPDSASRFSAVLDKAQSKNGCWAVWSALFRRDIIAKNNLSFCLSCGNYSEDMGFFLKYLMYTEKAVTLPDELYIYYDERPDSMMNKTAGRYRPADLNEVSRDVEAHFRIAFAGTEQEALYGLLHHVILLIGTRNPYGLFCLRQLRRMKKAFSDIADKAFFIRYNEMYYRFFCKSGRTEGSCLQYRREKVINRFFYDLHFGRLLFCLIPLNIAVLPEKICKKLFS